MEALIATGDWGLTKPADLLIALSCSANRLWLGPVHYLLAFNQIVTITVTIIIIIITIVTIITIFDYMRTAATAGKKLEAGN